MAEALALVSIAADPEATLCTCCRELLGVDGVSISLASSLDLESVCTTHESIARFEELEFTLGEGPDVDAMASGEPSDPDEFVGDADEAERRGPESATTGLGPSGVYSFPLSIGAARLGVLTLFTEAAAGLSATQHADALIAADALVHVILAGQGRAPAGTVALAVRDVGSFRAEIHQASGMLSEQIGCTVADALVQLRAKAYALDKPIAELARDVIARRVRLYRSRDDAIEWSGAE
jgi:hypothetical protein